MAFAVRGAKVESSSLLGKTDSIPAIPAVKRSSPSAPERFLSGRISRYVDASRFRLNFGNVKRHTLLRLDSFVDAVAGKRLTYKDLIAEVAP